MVRDINAYAIEHGYSIIKTPKCIKLPIVNKYIWLPIWLTFEYEYESRKHCRYTFEGFIYKLQRKADRKQNKRIIKQKREALNQLFTSIKK